MDKGFKVKLVRKLSPLCGKWKIGDILGFNNIEEDIGIGPSLYFCFVSSEEGTTARRLTSKKDVDHRNSL